MRARVQLSLLATGLILSGNVVHAAVITLTDGPTGQFASINGAATALRDFRRLTLTLPIVSVRAPFSLPHREAFAHGPPAPREPVYLPIGCQLGPGLPRLPPPTMLVPFISQM
jgi:hypothetical protein